LSLFSLSRTGLRISPLRFGLNSTLSVGGWMMLIIAVVLLKEEGVAVSQWV